MSRASEAEPSLSVTLRISRNHPETYHAALIATSKRGTPITVREWRFGRAGLTASQLSDMVGSLANETNLLLLTTFGEAQRLWDNSVDDPSEAHTAEKGPKGSLVGE